MRLLALFVVENYVNSHNLLYLLPGAALKIKLLSYRDLYPYYQMPINTSSRDLLALMIMQATIGPRVN